MWFPSEPPLNYVHYFKAFSPLWLRICSAFPVLPESKENGMLNILIQPANTPNSSLKLNKFEFLYFHTNLDMP